MPEQCFECYQLLANSYILIWLIKILIFCFERIDKWDQFSQLVLVILGGRINYVKYPNKCFEPVPCHNFLAHKP